MAPVRHLLLISGSLRAGSTNAAVLRTATEVLPASVTAVLYGGLGRLPAFNPDLDRDPLPPEVADLRDQVRTADAIVFSTPEYAGGLPGAFKNLLDWTVGDDRPGSIYRKPVAWVNVSPRGALDAHDSLRRVLGYVGADIVEPACIAVPVTAAMVRPAGTLADEEARQSIRYAIHTLTGSA